MTSDLKERLAKLSPAKRALLEAKLQEAASRPKGEGSIPRRSAGQVVPLSSNQQQLWYFEQLHPGTGVYNVPEFWRIKGSLDVSALTQAFSGLVKRHEVLRTVFEVHDERAVQIVRD